MTDSQYVLEQLKLWLDDQYLAYVHGEMMSIEEAATGQAVLGQVLEKIKDLENEPLLSRKCP